MDTVPFVVYDATVLLWTLDANGNAATAQYVGADAEKATMQQQYKERLLAYPGVAYQTAFHEDEEHAIELRNVWLWSVQTGSAQMPQAPQRNVTYLLAVIWYDEDAAAWCNRTYAGVTGRAQDLDGDSTYQVWRLRAQSLTESAGTGEPVLAPLISGQVIYVAVGGARQVLYNYSAANGTLVPVDPAQLADTATIAYTADGACQVSFGADAPVLTATAQTLAVNALVATGSTLEPATPRLEWWLGNRRVASLSSTGELVVVSLQSQAEPPPGGIAPTNPANPAWLFTLDTRCVAPSFTVQS